ncbi:type IV pilus assembly protein PilM [Paenibacillus castaneae]|uniref:pilus assembly protein PilM n=1 Tax=Paenibacillus castaneae TaxID=474957 RepID=UPI00141A7951|nr:pilus assembly protein PilM [Paenibacillus castaneae]NIK77300.1 type IV pilus assembly protein PilM [Paenibacillus castaneae]
MFESSNRIGLTIDQMGVRYVKAKKKKAREIESCGYLPFESGLIVEDQFTAIEILRDKLKHWVKSEKLTGASVTLSIPTSQVIIRKLTIESSNKKELKQLIELEIETALHLPFENPVYDYIVTASANGSSEVLVYVSPLKWIQQCVSLLESAGLRIRYCELASTALARAIKEKKAVPLTSAMLINLDKPNIEIYMFHDGNPVFMRVMNEYEEVAIKEEGLAPELIASMNAEISRLLNFYQYSIHEGQSKITDTLVSGYIKGREKLVSEFSQLQPEMKVEIVDFGSVLSKEKNDVEEDFRIPFGLAIRDGNAKGINLVPDRIINKKLFPAQLLVVSLIWLVCLITIVVLYTGNQSNLSRKEAETASLIRSNALLEQELANLNKKSQLDADPLAVIKSIQDNRQDAVIVLDDLHDMLPIGAILQTIEYSKPGSVSLIVKFSDMKQIADYLYKMRTLPYSGGAILQGFTSTETQMTARLEMKWKGLLQNADGEGTQEGGEKSNG